MNTKVMSQGELQHIEHCNKILQEHLNLVKMVVDESEKLFNNYLPNLSGYMAAIVELRTKFGGEVKHIYNSSRELRQATAGVNEIVGFMTAVERLDKMLTPELVEKLKRIQ